GYRRQESQGNNFVRCLDFVRRPSAWVVIGILVSQVSAALHQERSEEHQEEEEPVKHAILGGQRAPHNHGHHGSTERKRWDGPIPDLGGCQHGDILSARSVHMSTPPPNWRGN